MPPPETGTDAVDFDVDITNCDREPVHIPGRIQSFGALLSVTGDWIVNHASSNAAERLGLPDEVLVGQPLSGIIDKSAFDAIRHRMRHLASPDAVERLFALQCVADGPLCDLAMHRSGKSIVMEFEHSDLESAEDLSSYVRPMIGRLTGCKSIPELCQVAARQIRALTGMDRVMVYEFASDGSGTVIAETKEPDMEPFLGLTYPASDIPKQARKLFIRNQLRVIHDISDGGVAIEPSLNPDGEPLDLSLSTTRVSSPIHIEYLRNMGVGASLTLSVVRQDALWGLFACHHNGPKIPSYPLRTALELFGLLFAYTLEQVRSETERQETARSQMLHDQIMVQLAEDMSVAKNFDTIVTAIQDVIPHDGAVGWIDGEYQHVGHTPTKEEFMALMPFLNTTASGKVYASQCLSAKYPDGLDFVDRAAGLLVLPVSRMPRDFIVLFRREVAKSVRWAGDPNKPVTYGKSGARLTPRKSFEVWQQTVRHHCAEWTDGQIRSAETLRVTLMEVVLRMADATLRERARAQEHQELLIAELNHRVRNILNLIKGVVSQSAAGHADVASFTKVIGGRIHALAMAHDQITRENWQPASLRQLIEVESGAYLDDGKARLTISGPDALLLPAAHTTMALVLHEMMTNSLKYGALKSDHGAVSIKITQEPDGALGLFWAERGGPPVNAPNRRGFGTTIIERSIPYELKGKVDLRFVHTGVEASFVIPATGVHRFEVVDTPATAVVAQPRTNPKTTRPNRVLIVEDNIIIGLDAETLLQGLGVPQTVMVSSVAEALDQLERADFDFALLDINLGSETAFPIAEVLIERGVRFSFASGYGEASEMDDRFAHFPVMTKPYDAAELREVLCPAGEP